MQSEHIFEYRGKIFYRRYENPGRPALLCLHGFNDTSESFVFLLPLLNRYFDVYALDFRGHGQSPALTEGYYTTGGLLADVVRFTSDVLPESYCVLGHSMGAGIAARLAGLLPAEVKGLFLLEGFGGLAGPARDAVRLRESIRFLRRSRGEVREKTMTFAEARKRLSLIHPRVTAERIEILTHSLTRRNSDGSYSWHQDPLLKAHFSPIPFSAELSRYLWSEIACPVLLLFGEHTQFRPGAQNDPGQDATGAAPRALHELAAPQAMQEILSNFKDIRYIEIGGAGHNMHHDRPEEVMECMERFIQEKLPWLQSSR
ncbi:MAG: alpha/beta hydrolase [Spirochaetales bacterium]|nr:alpha/beta hydrolase [Spirochaetales bacterium]